MSASVIKPPGVRTSKRAPVPGKIIDFIQPIVSLLQSSHFIEMDLSDHSRESWEWQRGTSPLLQGRTGSRARSGNGSRVAMSCQPVWKRWLAQGRLCRWRNQRAVRERWGSRPLSQRSPVLRDLLSLPSGCSRRAPVCTLF